ncbi:MAG: preprotein translocase subunit SecG [Candidatus Brocadiales bacterium]|nr:preprotein translocase subunit SecG [Candidatus Bathyanammoxibius amoris]
MELNEKTVKWALAVIVVFGLVFTMTMMQMVSALKMFLVLTCAVLLGTILLQAGKGGGLAAIGGLQDQSSFGTRTSTFLSKLTYLIGAVFIVTTICLTKISSVTFVEKAAPQPAAEMPAGQLPPGHPPTEGLPPGHPPMEGLPPGHPPTEGLPPGHPSPGGVPAIVPPQEKPASATLGWQEKPEADKEKKQEAKESEEQKGSPDK